MPNQTFNIKLLAGILFILLCDIGCQKEKDKINNVIPLENTIVPNDFLSGNNYDQLFIEIQYESGFAPGSATLANLKTLLEQRLNKPGGITFIQNSIAPTGKTVLSIDDIKNIENTNRTQKTNGKILTAYFFFANADYASNAGSSKVLGVAYGNSSMAIFEKTIREFSGGIGKPSLTTLESTVIEHEFGHILGLVNNGTNMQTAHQDEPNGRHCNDNKCLMYYAVESSDFIANLMGGVIPSLNGACISDLQANGGK